MFGTFDPAIVILIYLAIVVAYILLYTFSTFLFSYKVFLMGEGHYNLGALVSGIAVFIGFVLYALVPYIAIIMSNIILGVILIFTLAIGSYIANAFMSKVDFFHENKKEDE